MDFKERFLSNIKQTTEGLSVSADPSSLFKNLSEEYSSEIESNPVLNFKSKLHQTSKTVTNTKLKESVFPAVNITQLEVINEDEINEKLIQEDLITTPEPTYSVINDLIVATTNTISKEESNKSVKENTDLFNQPNSKLPSPEIKILQKQIKGLEDWVYKISAAGPGSGEVNFRYLDDVNRDSIGNTDQILRYNPTDNKFFFGQLSGDQGPIKSLNFDNSGTANTPAPGTIYWNTAKDCLNVYQNDDTTLQVGLENYIRVHNATANTLTNGTLVQFSGVNGDGETPTCAPLLADSNFYPIYTIGVLTHDILPNENGRATTFGEIRNVDTSGTSSGEIWQVGDLLWASPYQAGKLTKVRPTAPNVVVSVAAVIKVGLTDGVLLIRPTITPRLYYGSFFDVTNQTANTINTPTEIKYSNTQISSGFSIANTSEIIAHNAGLYNYQFSVQIDSSTAAAAQNIWIWYRKNGQDVPATATQITVNKEFKVAAWNFIESMQAGDKFQLMWATDSLSVKIVAPPATAFCPSIPSVIMTVTQVNL